MPDRQPPPPPPLPPHPSAIVGPGATQFTNLPAGPASQPNFRPLHPGQQAVRVVDITPQKLLDEEDYMKRLTSYELYTIRKVIPKDSKDRGSWAKAKVTREALSHDDIVQNIQRLHKESKRTILEKKSALMPFQKGQVDKLIDEAISTERDARFEWYLAQLDRKEITNTKGHKETTSISVYLKRVPLNDLNPIRLFNAIERMRSTPKPSSLPMQPREAKQRQSREWVFRNENRKQSSKVFRTLRPPKPSNSEDEYPSDSESSESSPMRDYSTGAETFATTISGESRASTDGKEYDFDTKSSFTDRDLLALPVETQGQLITAFAKEILHGIEDDYGVRGSIARVSNALPELLKEFSEELSLQSSIGIEEDAAFFVDIYSKDIAHSFRILVDLEPELSSQRWEQLSMEDKMSLWTRKTTAASLANDDGSADHSKHLSMEVGKFGGGLDRKIPDLHLARTFLFTGQAYDRLLRKMHATAHLSSRRGQAIETIRETILRSLYMHRDLTKMKKLRMSESVRFEAVWDPRVFLNEQYPHNSTPKIDSIIALTGSSVDAQAATCGDYIQQVWPGIGDEVLHAVQAAIFSVDHSHESTLPDDTKVKVSLTSGLIIMEATGAVHGIADVGELFSWLYAACQSSPYQNELCFSNLSIKDVTKTIPIFRVDLNFTALTKEETEGPGTCWHALFRNPVIVRGFPILARDTPEVGLDVPIDMMAVLAEADRATIFNKQLLIKGFSTMLVPIIRIRNSLVWHFLYNKDNSRLSYLAARTLCPTRATIEEANFSCLQDTRHFLGWSSSASLYTGSRNINYDDIRFTGANLASSGCVLEKISISGGKFITMGASIMPGRKDKMLSLSTSGPYQCKMYSASRMHVVLYDTEARCAWLVDGANALLHLTRAQVSRKPYSDNPLILKIFPDASPTDGPGAALKILEAIAVTNYVIYDDEPGFGQSSSTGSKWGLKDVVLQNWHFLEQIQDYQTDLCAPGMPIRLAARDRLEGFGFLDLISGKSSIPPRVATLEASGRGWVDFTREIAAITLMARGFGELIQPNEDSNTLCKSWKQVPRGMDYLVARVSHLSDICEEVGNFSSKSLELVQGLYWHQGGRLYSPCAHKKSSQPCDRVQVLLPKLSLGTKRCPDPFVGKLNGAVIFGRSSRFSKWWPRNPQLAPVDNETECIAEDSRARSRSSATSHSEQSHESLHGSSTTPSDEAETAASSNPNLIPTSSSSLASSVDDTIIKTEVRSNFSKTDTLAAMDEAESFEGNNRKPGISRKEKSPVRYIRAVNSHIGSSSRAGPILATTSQTSDHGLHAASVKNGPAASSREDRFNSTTATDSHDIQAPGERGRVIPTARPSGSHTSEPKRNLRRVKDHIRGDFENVDG